MIFSLHMSWIRHWSLPDYCDRYMLISNTHCRWQIFSGLIFPSLIFLPFDFLLSVFPASCFLMRYLLLLDFSQTKVRRFPSHRMEPVGRIIFKCLIGKAVVRSAIILKSVLPLSKFLLLDHVIENGVINYPLLLAPRFIFISWFFKHRLLSRSTCGCPSFRCRINGGLMFKMLCWPPFSLLPPGYSFLVNRPSIRASNSFWLFWLACCSAWKSHSFIKFLISRRTSSIFFFASG